MAASSRSSVARFGAGLLAAALALLAAGQAPAAPQPLQAAADRAWADIHARTAIPGAVVAVVGPDGLVFVKGYGVSDVRSRRPVDPDRTLFQIGSVTKLFTAVLALQAAEAGRLDLDGDLRGRYPDLRIGRSCRAPITPRLLLAHQGGFDGDLSEVMTDRREQAARLDPVILARHLRCVRAPGVVPAYDNIGVGLLGEAAARGFGLSYAEAVDSRILRPLGMTRSSVGLPAGHEAEAAACHRVEADGKVSVCAHTFMRRGFEGAGAIAATGADMGRFLQMLLAGGRGPEGAILSPAAFARFADLDRNRFAPGVPGMGELVEETTLAGRPALFHTGGYDGFSTGLYVLPGSRYGVFVGVEQYPGLPRRQDLTFVADLIARRAALAHNDGYKAVEAIASAVAAATPAAAPAPPPAIAGPALPPAAVAGYYSPARTASPSLIDRMLVAPLFGVTVAPRGAHAIAVNGQVFDWLGGGAYRSRATGRISAFKPTSLGLAYSPDSSGAFLRSPASRTPLAILLFVATLALLLLVAGLAALVLRHGRGRGPSGLIFAASAATLVYLWLEMQAYPTLYYGGGALWPVAGWRLLFHLALAAGLLGAWRAGRLILARGEVRPGWGGRIALGATGLLYLAFLVQALGWGLIGRIGGA